MNPILQNRDKQLVHMKMLSALGLEKRVMKNVGGVNPKETDPYHDALGPLPHRKGELWLQNRYNGILVDRLIRVYESMFGDITADKPVTTHQLHSLVISYLAIYPYDNMSATRIHYLIALIKSGARVKSVVVNIDESGCTSCGQRYYIHPKMTRKCSACELANEAKTDPEIFDEIKRTIYVENTNLANAKKKSLTIKPNVLKILEASRANDKVQRKTA
jgi:hypothetical protein